MRDVISIKYIYIGLVLLNNGMNVKFRKCLSWAPIGFLQGDYEDISSMWYIEFIT